MLAQIPRKPTFPDHMIKSVIARIEKDVNDDVIPVSTGIYSQYKLNQKLEAIPKPFIVDYNDPIFFDVANYQALPCKTQRCLNCKQQYGNKRNIPAQCKFCTIWLCSQCICPRKRYHPRAKESNTPRFQICYKCDDKFLSLILNHSYVESKALLDEAISKLRDQKNAYERQCDKREQDSTVTKDMVAKNKFKISSMKKEKIDVSKNLASMRKEKEDLLFKIHIRQQYVRQLKEKKERIIEEKKRNLQDETQVTKTQQSRDSSNNAKQAKQQKVKRTLTQKNVISEAIFQQKAEKKQNEIVKGQKELQLPVQLQIEQNKGHFNGPLPNVQESKTQQIVKNFFNFHEWGHCSENQKTKQLVNSPKQQNFAKSLEEQIKIDQNFSPPKKNILIETSQQSEDIKQSIARMRLAEIFKKQEKQQILMQQQQLSEPQSLDAEVIQHRRKDIMKAAILQSQFQRLSIEQNQTSQAYVPQKCSCDIY